MLPLGHMGIGRRLVAPWSEGLPIWPIYLGCVVPDIIDKPLYHLGKLITGHTPVFGVITGTRTVGHTTVLAVLIGVLALWRRSNWWKALALGMASHLVLDTLGDFVNLMSPGPKSAGPSGGISAVFWPALGWSFPPARMPTFGTYAVATFSVANVLAEVTGGVLLYFDWRLRRSRTDAAR